MLKQRFSTSSTPIYKRLTPLLIPFLFLVLLVLSYVLAKPFLTVNSVSCRLSSSTCPDQLILLLNQSKGKWIFLIDKKRLRTNILSTGIGENPVIQIKGNQLQVSLDKSIDQLPLNVIFTSLIPSFNFEIASSSSNLSPWKEILQLQATQSSQTMLLNSALLLENSDKESSVYLFASQLPSKEQMKIVSTWIKSLPSFDLELPELFFFPNFIVISKPNDFIAIFSYQTDLDNILKSWAQIKSAALAKKTYVLDFRYNHPILR